MSYSYVSDLFGNKISDSSPIVMIHTRKLNEYMTKVDEDIMNNTSIWKYNKKTIGELLSNRNVDPNNFVILGDVLLNGFSDSIVLVLGNKNICLSPDGIEEVGAYSKGKLFLPYTKYNEVKHYALGAFYFSSDKHDISNIGILPLNATITISKSPQNEIESNEFNLLSVSKFGIKAINKAKLLKSNLRHFRLMSNDNKFITMQDNEYTTRQSNGRLTQLFSYNAQGELISDGKCLTHKGKDITAEKCGSKKSNQQWIMAKNKILPSNNFDKCIDITSYDDATIKLNECNDYADTQRWSTENDESASSEKSHWKKYFGKNVVLVENNNPWFVNVNDSKVAKVLTKKPNVFTDYDTNPYYQPKTNKNAGNYKNSVRVNPTFVLDPNDRTLGHGYSFASRGINKCQKKTKKIEGFNGKKNSNESCTDPDERQVFMLVMIIMAILLFYKMNKK